METNPSIDSIYLPLGWDRIKALAEVDSVCRRRRTVNWSRKFSIIAVCSFLMLIPAGFAEDPVESQKDTNEQVQQSKQLPYYRAWRGERRKVWQDHEKLEFTFKHFLMTLNDWLIPATLSCCSESSVTAYYPALPPKKFDVPGFSHDELAFIVYSSEEDYKKVRESGLEGKLYGPIHSWVFDSTLAKDNPGRSRSLVPTVFLGEVDLKLDSEDPKVFKENAYDVVAKPVNWQKGEIVYRILKRKKASLEDDVAYVEALEDYFSELKVEGNSGKTLLGEVVIVTDTYMIELQNWSPNTKQKPIAKQSPTLAKVMELASNLEVIQPKRISKKGESLRYQDLLPGKAFNFIFPVGKPTPQRVRHPLLADNPKEFLSQYLLKNGVVSSD